MFSSCIVCLFLLFLIANIVTTSKALVTRSDALVSTSFLVFNSEGRALSRTYFFSWSSISSCHAWSSFVGGKNNQTANISACVETLMGAEPRFSMSSQVPLLNMLQVAKDMIVFPNLLHTQAVGLKRRVDAFRDLPCVQSQSHKAASRVEFSRER